MLNSLLHSSERKKREEEKAGSNEENKNTSQTLSYQTPQSIGKALKWLHNSFSKASPERTELVSELIYNFLLI